MDTEVVVTYGMAPRFIAMASALPWRRLWQAAEDSTADRRVSDPTRDKRGRSAANTDKLQSLAKGKNITTMQSYSLKIDENKNNILIKHETENIYQKLTIQKLQKLFTLVSHINTYKI